MVEDFSLLEIKDPVNERRVSRLSKHGYTVLKKDVEAYNVLVKELKKSRGTEEDKLRTLEEAYSSIWSQFRHCIKFNRDTMRSPLPKKTINKKPVKKKKKDDKGSLLNPDLAGAIGEDVSDGKTHKAID